MRAIELRQFGLEGLQSVVREVPVPAAGQVRLRMRAASLNYHDLVTVLGVANPRLPLPVVPLSDGCGVVEAIGEGVTRFRVGDRVTTLFFSDWMAGEPTRQRLARVPGEHVDGVLADCMAMEANGLVAVPDYLSDEEAATLPCAALTAWRSVVVEAKVKAGDTVLLQGTGGVSLFALQFAKMLGATTIITSGSEAKLEKLAALAPDHTINYRETPDWARRVKDITGGRGVDHVVEVGGAGTLQQSLKALRIGGHISMIGVLTGVANVVPTALIMALNATVKGITVGSRDDAEAMCRAMAAHQLRPVIGERFGFAEAPAAFACMQQAAHFGKIVIRH
ncbi:MAG: NAD(P)-dependent alcohol dehydrogenase [Moraxellaceae bacterium]|nr:NAD(P)-dependent alcohol dehydrogenase [Moraxellaceae bacterium]